MFNIIDRRYEGFNSRECELERLHIDEQFSEFSQHIKVIEDFDVLVDAFYNNVKVTVDPEALCGKRTYAPQYAVAPEEEEVNPFANNMRNEFIGSYRKARGMLIRIQDDYTRLINTFNLELNKAVSFPFDPQVDKLIIEGRCTNPQYLHLVLPELRRIETVTGMYRSRINNLFNEIYAIHSSGVEKWRLMFVRFAEAFISAICDGDLTGLLDKDYSFRPQNDMIKISSRESLFQFLASIPYAYRLEGKLLLEGAQFYDFAEADVRDAMVIAAFAKFPITIELVHGRKLTNAQNLKSIKRSLSRIDTSEDKSVATMFKCDCAELMTSGKDPFEAIEKITALARTYANTSEVADRVWKVIPYSEELANSISMLTQCSEYSRIKYGPEVTGHVRRMIRKATVSGSPVFGCHHRILLSVSSFNERAKPYVVAMIKHLIGMGRYITFITFNSTYKFKPKWNDTPEVRELALYTIISILAKDGAVKLDVDTD